MPCCNPTEAEGPHGTIECPACGARGRRVPRQTLVALVEQTPTGSHRFCRTQDCEVIYFPEQGGEVVLIDRLRVRVGQKETTADRTLCYCFDYTAADVASDASIADRITERCRQGEDRCAITNPQGACCLGNVRSVMRSQAPALKGVESA